MKLRNTKQHSPRVSIIDFEADGAGDSVTIGFFNDVHIDSKSCDEKRLKEDMENIIQRNGYIFLGGDFYDAMQTRYDPRRSPEDYKKAVIMPDGVFSEDIIGNTLSYGVNFLEPYKSHIVHLHYGNHETVLLKNSNYDIVQRTAANLHPQTTVGAYRGWIVLRFFLKKKLVSTERIYYFHGTGHGAKVTLGSIDLYRLMTKIYNANIIWLEHLHNKVSIEYSSEYLNNYCEIENKDTIAFVGGSYANDYFKSNGKNFVAQKGEPKPLGGYAMKFTLNCSSNKKTIRKSLISMGGL